MKRVILVGLLFCLGACATSVNDGDQPFERRGSNEVTIHIINGTDGTPVAAASVTVLVGESRVQAARAAESDGIYTISQLSNGTFWVSVNAAGFREFGGLMTLTGNQDISSPTADITYEFYQILLFPSGQATEDFRVRVHLNIDGSPIAGATVSAVVDRTDRGIEIGTTTRDVIANQLFADRLEAATDSNGTATFAAADLVSNATYKVFIFDAQVGGAFLNPILGTTTFQVGAEFPEVVVLMGPTAEIPVAISANNEAQFINATTADTSAPVLTELVVTFPYPIELCDSSDPDLSGVRNFDNAGALIPLSGGANCSDGTATLDCQLASSSPSISGNQVTVVPNTSLPSGFTWDGIFGDNPALGRVFSFDGIEIKPLNASDGSCRELRSIGLRDLAATPTNRVLSQIIDRRDS